MVNSAFLLDGVMVIHPWKKRLWKYFHSQSVTEDILFQNTTLIDQELKIVCLNYSKTIYYVQRY